MIKNINEKLGDPVEFSTVEEMAEAVRGCGYMPEDGLQEGRDYIDITPPTKKCPRCGQERTVVNGEDDGTMIYSGDNGDVQVHGDDWIFVGEPCCNKCDMVAPTDEDDEDEEDWLAQADSRETSPEIMEAIEFLATDARTAEEIWEDPTEEELSAIEERVTKNGLLKARDFCWGAAGSGWATAAAEEPALPTFTLMAEDDTIILDNVEADALCDLEPGQEWVHNDGTDGAYALRLAHLPDGGFCCYRGGEDEGQTNHEYFETQEEALAVLLKLVKEA